MSPQRKRRQTSLPKATITLALKWLRGEASTKEVQSKIGSTSINHTTYVMGTALRQAYCDGMFQVTIGKEARP